MSTRAGVARRNSHDTAIIRPEPRIRPSKGAMKMKAMVLASPLPTIAQMPLFATAAPTRPPINACEELEGMPYHHVIRFQTIAPVSAPNTT